MAYRPSPAKKATVSYEDAKVLLTRSNMPSSNVRDMEWTPATGNLTITFQCGRTYLYYAVSSAVAHGIKKSKEPGQYVERYLKPRYLFNEI
jgi:hypothetical protein